MYAALTCLLLAAASGDATEALKARDREIRATLPTAGEEMRPESRAQTEAVLAKLVDMEGIAKASIGRTWAKLSKKDRTRYLSAFERRFKKAIGEQLDVYRSTSIDYAAEKQEGDRVLVPTSLRVKGEPLEVVYAMRKLTGGWRIVDIVIDGVSTVENYQSSFAKLISQKGVEELIERLSRGSQEP